MLVDIFILIITALFLYIKIKAEFLRYNLSLYLIECCLLLIICVDVVKSHL